MSNTAPRSDFNPALLAASMAALTGAAGTAAAPAKDKATVYLAIGTLRDDERAPHTVDDFDPSKDLINLPQMQGLDNMREDDRKANTQEFADTQSESNDFLNDLKEQVLATLEPGERRVIPVYVTVYRVKDQVVAQPKAERVKKQFV